MTDAQFLYDACTRPGPAFAARIEAQVQRSRIHARVLAAHPDPAGYIAQIVEQAWLDGLREATSRAASRMPLDQQTCEPVDPNPKPEGAR